MPTISNATVATGTGLSTAGNGGRKLVRLADGSLWSVTRTTSSVSLYKSVNDGTSWSFVETYSSSSLQDASLATDGERVYLLVNANSSNVRYLAYNASGVRLFLADVDSSQSAIGNVSLAINEAGTEIHAAWSSKNATYPNSFNIRYAKGTINGDGSVTWGTVEQVTLSNISGLDYLNLSVSMYGNEARMFANTGTVYVPVENSVGEISGYSAILVFKKGSGFATNSKHVNSGYTFRQIYRGDYVQSNPVGLFIPTTINGLTNGRLWTGWHGKDTTDTSKHNIRTSFSDDGGSTWATPVKLTSGNLYDRQNVTLSADKTGKVFALYEDHQWSPDLDIYMRTFSGGSWGAPVAVAEADPAAESNPSALVDYSLQMTTPPFVFTNATDGIKFSGNFNVGASVSPASGALGNKETATLTAYTVTPEAGSTVTSIVEKVNGVTVNTFNNPASLSRTLTVPTATWDTLAYFAAHTASITVTDSNGATTVTTYSFDKRLATGASLLEATKANADAKNRMRSQLDAIGSRVGVANGSSTNQIISAIDSRNVVKRQNGTAVVSGGQIVVNTLGFLPKTITIRSSATQNGTYSELLGTNESRNGTTITQNAFTNITATGFTATISGTTVAWEAFG